MSTTTTTMSAQRPQRKKGLVGGLVGLIGTGVGASVEYHHHRKERKAAMQSAAAEREVIAGPSSRPESVPTIQYSSPPAYEDDQRSSVRDEKRTLDEKHPDIDSDTSDSSSNLSIDADEEAWNLDELAELNEPPSYEAAINTNQSNDALARDVLTDRKVNTKPHTPLPLPVIIPQRRPRNKARGFVRAYAPVLENVGIDQETFLKFLKNFHTASQANPLFNAVIIAANIAGMAPSAIAMAVTMSVQIVASVGKEIDSRKKTNTFLDRINEELFKPAGCYAMVVKYKSDQDVANATPGLLTRLGVGSEKVDFSSLMAIAKYDVSPGAETSSNLASKMKVLRLGSGETRGSIQMPEAAPLIFPGVDNALASGEDGSETFKDKTRDAKKFLASYADRRAQMAYARNDPASALTLPEQEMQMKSKWSDPDHPMFNNGLVGLVSGGLLRPKERDAFKREEKRERKEMKFGQKIERREAKFERKVQKNEYKYGSRSSEMERGWQSGSSSAVRSSSLEREERKMLRRNDKSEQKMEKRYGPRVDADAEGDYFAGSSTRYGVARTGVPQQRQKKGGLIGGVKKVMQQDVLYLMIVPMPSESELSEAREALEMAKRK